MAASSLISGQVTRFYRGVDDIVGATCHFPSGNRAIHPLALLTLSFPGDLGLHSELPDTEQAGP